MGPNAKFSNTFTKFILCLTKLVDLIRFESPVFTANVKPLIGFTDCHEGSHPTRE